MAKEQAVLKVPEYVINRKQPGLISKGIKSAADTIKRIGGFATTGYAVGHLLSNILPGAGTVGMTLAANEITIPAVKALALSVLAVIPPAVVLPVAGAVALGTTAVAYSLAKGAICGGQLIAKGISNKREGSAIANTEASIEGKPIAATVGEEVKRGRK